MRPLVQERLFADDGMCGGRLNILIADESSWRCTVCDWSGWPEREVEPGTGIILRQLPHKRTWYPWLHEKGVETALIASPSAPSAPGTPLRQARKG